MRHVIIGAGPAGVIAAETLRKLDPDSSVTLIGDEPEPPYSRMALPYYLTKQIDEAGTHLRKGPGYFQSSGIDVIRDRVVAIQRDNKTLELGDHTDLAYDKLLIASGARPTSPPIPGMDLAGIFPCWTLADARNIAQRARPGAKVVLMGAGFIGCIILQALAKSGAELTVVEMEDRMVPRMMNQVAGNMIKKWCTNHGVRVLTGTRVEAIKTTDRAPTPSLWEKHAGDGSAGNSPVVRGLELNLDNGESIPADLVVSATGVAPNVGLLEDTGIEIDQGILVNEHMQTNDTNIFAAGDVAQGRDFSTGEYSVQAIQPTAAEHGQIAARNMAGMDGAIHRGSVNMNVLDTMGLISSSFGLWMGTDSGDHAELHNPERYRYINLQFEEDILVGATCIGLTQHVGVLRGLIQSRIRLRSWKEKLMQDPTRIMEAYLANTQALGFNAGKI